jgi:hypothetical protein
MTMAGGVMTAILSMDVGVMRIPLEGDYLAVFIRLAILARYSIRYTSCRPGGMKVVGLSILWRTCNCSMGVLTLLKNVYPAFYSMTMTAVCDDGHLCGMTA